MNRDSDELVKDSLSDPGFHLNRNVMKKQFMTKSTTLKRKNITPMILNHSDRYGTAIRQSNASYMYAGSIVLECRTLAIPPVAIVIVNHVQV
jgi:hypothetical protein